MNIILRRFSRISIFVFLSVLAACQRTESQTSDAFDSRVKESLLRHPEVIKDVVRVLAEKDDKVEATEMAKRIKSNAAYLNQAGGLVFNPSGRVTVVEISDVQCTFCKKMAAPLEAILKANTDVRLVVYQNGAFGELSEDAASLSGRLTQQHKDGYSFYNAALSQASLSPQGLAQLARQYGLSSKEIATAMQPDERAKAVEPGRAVTQALAINGTPSFIVGDQMIFGAQGKDLSDAIAVTRKSLN